MIQTDWYRRRSGLEVRQTLGERPPFLVDGILSPSITLAYGETESCKSMLTAALCAALIRGDETFLGREVAPKARGLKVAVIAGDEDGEDEFTERLTGVLTDDQVQLIGFITPDILPFPRAQWEQVLQTEKAEGTGLLVIDHLTAFSALNDEGQVGAFYDMLKMFTRAGIAVLVIAHVSEKRGQNGQRSDVPLGHSLIRARARWRWHVVKTASDDVVVKFGGNRNGRHEVTARCPGWNARFDVVATADSEELRARSERRKRARQGETKAKRDGYREFVRVNCHGMNDSEAGRAVAAEFGGSPDTHRKRLGQGAYGVTREPDGSWTDMPEAA